MEAQAPSAAGEAPGTDSSQMPSEVTAKAAASIVLSADRSTISADRDDLSYVTASVVDADNLDL